MAFVPPTVNRGARSVPRNVGFVSGTQLLHGVVILPSVSSILLLVQQKQCIMLALCRRGSKAGQLATGPFKLSFSLWGPNPDFKIHVAAMGKVRCNPGADGEPAQLRDHPLSHVQEPWPYQEVIKGEPEPS